MINRREFVANSTAAVAASTLLASGVRAAEEQDSAQQSGGEKKQESQSRKFVPNRIGISTYSFWRFRKDSKLTMSKCIDLAAEMGFDGVELLRIQMDDDSDSYLQKLKRQAFVNGLDLMGMSTHQGFVTPDKEVRQKNIDKTIGFIEMAYKLGIPTIRVNTGR